MFFRAIQPDPSVTHHLWSTDFGIQLFSNSPLIKSDNLSVPESIKLKPPKVKTISDKELERRASEVAVSYDWVISKSKEKEADIFKPRITSLKVQKNLGGGKLICIEV